MIPDKVLNEVRASLYAGHYNLLLGSGASYGSTNSSGKPVPSVAELTEALCKHTGAPITSTLAQVSRLLKPLEVEKFITKPFSGCRPGEGLKRLTKFVWKTIYTFNVDDALEAAYERTPGVKQHAAPVNFTQLYSVPTDKSKYKLSTCTDLRERQKLAMFSPYQTTAGQFEKEMHGCMFCPKSLPLSHLFSLEPL